MLRETWFSKSGMPREFNMGNRWWRTPKCGYLVPEQDCLVLLIGLYAVRISFILLTMFGCCGVYRDSVDLGRSLQDHFLGGAIPGSRIWGEDGSGSL